MAWLTTPSPWNYRKYKNIQGTSSGSQTNYQMKLTIHWGTGTDNTPTIADIYLNTNANQNFSDIRFTDSDGTTLLSYWIDPATYSFGVKTDIWIKIPSTPPNGAVRPIYIYYGNPSQTSISNTNTLTFYDDFSAGLSKWTNTDPTYITVSGGQLQINSASNGQIASAPISLTTDFILTFDILTNGFERYHATRVLLQNNTGILEITGAPSAYIGFQDYGGDFGRVTSPLFNGASSSGFTGDLAVSQNTWYHIKITKSGSSTNLKYWTFSQIESQASAINFTGPTTLLGYIAVQTRYGISPPSTAATCTIDNILLRKYASPEPSLIDTGLQETYTANLSVSSNPSGAEIFLNGGDTGKTTTDFFTLYPGSYDVLLRKSGYLDWFSGIFTLDPNQSRVVTGNLIPSQITATDIILDRNFCIGTCTVTATITWNNPGPDAYFEPAIVTNGARTGSGSTILLSTNQTYTRAFTINLPIGSHNICPDPN